MDHIDIFEKTQKKSVRIERIIHLSSMLSKHDFPDDINDSFTEDWEEISRAIGIKLIEFIHNDELTNFLYNRRKLGFLVLAGIPRPDKFSTIRKGYVANGFGEYKTKWFYVEDFEDVFPLINDWKSKYIESERKLKSPSKWSQKWSAIFH